MTFKLRYIKFLYTNSIEIAFLDKLALFLIYLFRRRFLIVTYTEY